MFQLHAALRTPRDPDGKHLRQPVPTRAQGVKCPNVAFQYDYTILTFAGHKEALLQNDELQGDTQTAAQRFYLVQVYAA